MDEVGGTDAAANNLFDLMPSISINREHLSYLTLPTATDHSVFESKSMVAAFNNVSSAMINNFLHLRSNYPSTRCTLGHFMYFGQTS